MADTGKKKALNAFFSKGKAKAPTKGGPRDEDGGAEAAAPLASAPASSSGAVSNADSWVDTPSDSGRVELAAAHIGTRVADLEEDDERGGPLDYEAEEARKAFWNARQNIKKTAKKLQDEAPAAPAAPSGWRSRTVVSSQSRSGPLNVKDTTAFPTLERAASGLPPGAKFADTSSDNIANLGKATKWAALAGDDEDEEEEEEEQAATAAAAVAAPAAAAAPAAKPAAAPAPAAAPSGPTDDVSLLLPGSGPSIEDADEVKKTIDSIVRELRSSGDAPACLARVGETRFGALEASRTSLVEALLNAGLDAETAAERTSIRKVLLGLAPARVATPAMVAAGVGRVTEFLDDMLVDIPKAVDYLAEMLRGVVIGSLAGPSDTPCVPSSGLPEALCAKMGVKKTAAPAPSAVEAITVAVAAVSVSEPASAAASEPAAEPEGEDVDAMFASAKKKKKSKSAAASE